MQNHSPQLRKNIGVFLWLIALFNHFLQKLDWNLNPMSLQQKTLHATFHSFTNSITFSIASLRKHEQKINFIWIKTF